MEGVGRDLRYYWARFDELAIEDGILGVRNPVEDGPDTQFCAIVPTSRPTRNSGARTLIGSWWSLWSTENH